MEVETLTLYDEDGTAAEMELLDTIEYLEETYVVLFPLDDDYEGPVVIMREDAGEYYFIDEQDIIDGVFRIFCESSEEE